jgi:hypothetical protein
MSVDVMSAVLHKALLGFFTDLMTNATTASLLKYNHIEAQLSSSNLGLAEHLLALKMILNVIFALCTTLSYCVFQNSLK